MTSKIDELYRELHEISTGVAEVRERLARVEAKVDAMSGQMANGRKTDGDHEKRIRELELARAKAVGIASSIAAIVGTVASAVASWFFRKVM